MTDPTADAIAALDRAIVYTVEERDGEVTLRIGAFVCTVSDDASVAALLAFDAEQRRVRSALLSAQGQAGKPVAWFIRPRGCSGWVLTPDEAEVERCRATGGAVEPFYGTPTAQEPEPATLRALRNARLFVLEEYSRRVECHDDVKEEAFIAEAGDLADEIDSALATIKGLET